MESGGFSCDKLVLSGEFLIVRKWLRRYSKTFQFGAAGGLPSGRGEQVDRLQDMLVLFIAEFSCLHRQEGTDVALSVTQQGLLLVT